MTTQLCLLPTAISELTAQVYESHQLMLSDRYGLLAALLAESLGHEERLAIDQLLQDVVQGQITLTDTLSRV